ncbi:MAG TPA: hypothetical protein VG708_12560 [Mycobacteriales bacterium]|nr:hypothetical protein [Mycobacteriales bacterium]
MPPAPARPRREAIEEPLLPPVEPTVDLVGDSLELEEILDRRWAVND